MERKLGFGARAAILGAAFVVCVACWAAVFTLPPAWPGFGPPLSLSILAVILASQAFGWAAAVALHGSPRRAWRQFAGAQT